MSNQSTTRSSMREAICEGILNGRRSNRSIERRHGSCLWRACRCCHELYGSPAHTQRASTLIYRSAVWWCCSVPNRSNFDPGGSAKSRRASDAFRAAQGGCWWLTQRQGQERHRSRHLIRSRPVWLRTPPLLLRRCLPRHRQELRRAVGLKPEVGLSVCRANAR
jgi:hypothetical protein